MLKNSKPPARIFGTDGIRALAGQRPLDRPFVKQIGRAAGLVMKRNAPARVQPALIVARDTRASGLWIEKSLYQGLGLAGCKAYSCGVLPTAAISALLQEGKFLGGVVISASHNPAEFNGIKFFSGLGKKIPDAWESEIEEILFNPKPTAKNKAKPARRKSGSDTLPALAQAEERYLNFLKASLPSSFSLAGLNWVIDCANGSAFSIASRILSSLGAQVHAIHCKPDGKNINLKCGALHLESLRAEVLRRGAHGGCAFDGDADRALFVDEKGRVMDGDVLIGMAAEHWKKKGALKGNTVVATVMANFGFLKAMREKDIRVVVTPVGDRSVAEAMESSGAVLGGEQSGHIIFSQWLPTGDGLLTALQILRVLKESGKKLSIFTDAFPKFPQVLLNLKVKQKLPLEELPALNQAIRKAESDLNGNGRVLVRYSGTEPLLRIMLEGSSLSGIRRMAEDLSQLARSFLC